MFLGINAPVFSAHFFLTVQYILEGKKNIFVLALNTVTNIQYTLTKCDLTKCLLCNVKFLRAVHVSLQIYRCEFFCELATFGTVFNPKNPGL